MDIQALGAWGELLGGIGGVVAAIGVIATLLYLARQVQQNTRSVQSSAYAAFMSGNAAVHETHMRAAEILPLYFYGGTDEWDFESPDYMKFHGHATQIFMNFEMAFLFHMEGVVDDTYFASRMRLMRRALQIPGLNRWWQEWAGYFYDERFVAHAAEITEDLEVELTPMGA
jgi:hypothetical protein